MLKLPKRYGRRLSTTIDTAEVYREGHSEQIVAQALSDVRDEAVYSLKFLPIICNMTK